MTIRIAHADSRHIRDQLEGLCALLRDSVDGGASVNFVAPLDDAVALAYWERAAADIDDGARVVIVATDGDFVAGCAHLVPARQPNGMHRAEIQKVLVHSAYRRRGIAGALMSALEDEARKLQRWLLVLDTEQGSGAEALYEKLGYARAGGIPDFALSADGLSYRANVFYYKRLD